MAKKKLHPTKAFRRGIQVRQAEEGDVRYFYAGYKQGAFDEYLQPKPDMDPAEFLAWLGEVSKTATAVFTSTYGEQPLSYIHTIELFDRMEVHAIWMPWATPRARVESAVKFFYDMNEDFTVMSVFSEDNKAFPFHVRRYGVARFVGKIKNYFTEKDGYMFQGNRIMPEGGV